MLNLNPCPDRQQDNPVSECEKCRQEVYHGEARFQWEGRWLCPDCFRALLTAARKQLALEMGLEVERYV